MRRAGKESGSEIPVRLLFCKYKKRKLFKFLNPGIFPDN